MQKFTYYSPTKIVFGENAVDQLAACLQEQGARRVLLIYGGSSAEKSGLLARVRAQMRDANIGYAELGGVVPNPLLSKVREGIEKATSFGADFILAVGGGSVIDTAKAVGFGTADVGGDVWQRFWIDRTPITKCLPIGCILTMAAAGSETSDSCVITNDEQAEPTKRGVNSDKIRSRFAIMDPTLTYSLPRYQLASGVADIFMHTAERYFAVVFGNHLSDEFAEGLFRDIIEYGPKGLADPHDYEAMSEIMWCGSVSHINLTGLGSKGDTARAGDWACHQLGMELSAEFDCTHGASLTAIWASWARYVVGENPARFAQLGRRVFGITETDDVRAADEAICRVEAFFRALDLPTDLADLLGKPLTDEGLKKAALGCTYGNKRTIGGFRVLGYDDVLRIYTAANKA